MTQTETTKATDSEASTAEVRKPRRQGVLQLAAILLAVCLLWGLVFPMISETAGQQEYSQRLQDQGIDPMALFYTDHPAMLKQLKEKR